MAIDRVFDLVVYVMIRLQRMNSACRSEVISLLSNEEAPPNANTVRLQNLVFIPAWLNIRKPAVLQRGSTAGDKILTRFLFQTNPNRDKSQLGSTRYPVICVAYGNCMDKGEPSNRREFLLAKGGELCLEQT